MKRSASGCLLRRHPRDQLYKGVGVWPKVASAGRASSPASRSRRAADGTGGRRVLSRAAWHRAAAMEAVTHCLTAPYPLQHFYNTLQSTALQQFYSLQPLQHPPLHFQQLSMALSAHYFSSFNSLLESLGAFSGAGT